MRAWQETTLTTLNPIALKMRKIFFKKNHIIILNGEMGSGKTTFLKAALSEYNVSSPSFLHCLYYGEDFLHIDAYTLKKEHLINLNIEENLKDCCIIIEWGNLIQDFIKNITANIIILELKTEKGRYYIRQNDMVY